MADVIATNQNSRREDKNQMIVLENTHNQRLSTEIGVGRASPAIESPKNIFMKTELESKRKLNWSELGHFPDTRNQQLQELAQNSLVLSNPSTFVSAAPPMTAPSNPTANCQKCKIWKRTN